MKEKEFLDLRDIDIEIKIRSGHTELAELDKVLNDIMSSSVLAYSDYLVMTEKNLVINAKGSGEKVSTILIKFSTLE